MWLLSSQWEMPQTAGACRMEGRNVRADLNQENFIINLDQDWQCRWWSKELGVAPEILKEAIREVGPLARNVRRYLRTIATRAER